MKIYDRFSILLFFQIIFIDHKKEKQDANLQSKFKIIHCKTIKIFIIFLIILVHVPNIMQ